MNNNEIGISTSTAVKAGLGGAIGVAIAGIILPIVGIIFVCFFCSFLSLLGGMV